MIRRSTWYFLGIFAVLLAAVVLVPKWQQSHPQPTPTSAPVNPEIIPSSKGKITEITVSDTTGQLVTLQAREKNQWSVIQPAGLEWSADQVNGAANGLDTGRVLSELTTQPPASAMGLDKPPYTVTVKLDSGEETTLKIGNLTPAGNAYYAQIDNEPAEVLSKTIVDQLVQLLTAGKPPATPSPEAGPTAASPS